MRSGALAQKGLGKDLMQMENERDEDKANEAD
jgi:hypothetical protein